MKKTTPNIENTQKNSSTGRYSSKNNMKKKEVKPCTKKRTQRWSEYAGAHNN